MLIEKAAAKLHGSYEALNGGTFSEAFGMLTGCPVQNIRLGRYKQPEPPPAGAPEGAQASFEVQLKKWQAKGYDYDELYARLLSYKAAGFLIGCSTFFQKEAEISQARAVGIQVPHAYGLLELRTNPADDAEQLVKLRNPNGHAGWRGEWSRTSPKWTYETRTALGIDSEDGGVFWMGWADFITYFAEVTVCRLRSDYLEARQGGWLPSVFGCGQAVVIEVYAHTKLELTLHQESHANRGEASIATLVDLGAAVVKLDQMGDAGGGGGVGGGGGGGGGDGAASSGLSLVAYGERGPASSVSLDTTLELDGFTSRYLVVPLCLGHMSSPEPRKFVAAALSNQPLAMETVPLPPAQLASAMIAIALKHGDKTVLLSHPMLGEALNIYTIEEDSGYVLVAENLQPVRIRVEIDASERTVGFHCSRGALFCQDVLPPRSRQVVMILSVDMRKKQHGMGMRFGGGALDTSEILPDGAGHIPALADLGPLAPLHEPQPMPQSPGGGSPWPASQPPTPGGVDISALASSIMSQMNQGRP